MVTKSKTGANLEAMSTVERAADETVQQETSLEFLMAEKVRVDAALKAARAAMPEVTKLERVIAKQASQETWLPVNLAKRVMARMAAGQDQGQAMEEVFAFLREATYAELTRRATTE
jgi:hypothetical protein